MIYTFYTLVVEEQMIIIAYYRITDYKDRVQNV